MVRPKRDTASEIVVKNSKGKEVTKTKTDKGTILKKIGCSRGRQVQRVPPVIAKQVDSD